MTQQKVPVGYKQTEVGIIPTDWEVKELGNIGESIIGLTYSPSDVSVFGSLVHRSSNITEDNRLAYYDNVFVSKEIPEKLILKKGDILICVRNGSRRLIGKSAYIIGESIGETFGAFMSVFRSAPDQNSKYIFYQIISNLILRQIDKSLGATINQITNKTLNEFIAPFPPTLTEQNNITRILSDTDELINQLDELITKKKQIKQGSMQELLTPKKDWEVKKLENIVTINKGSQINKSDLTLTGKYPCLNGGIEASGYTDKYNTENDTITISEGGNSCGYINYNTQRLWCGGHCYAVRIINEQNNDKLFLFNMLKFKESLIMGLRVGSGLPNIQKKSLYEFEISVPSSKEEQIRIAKILSDMDNEIEELEEKKAKYEQIKQGAMQQLLTGKIRLK